MRTEPFGIDLSSNNEFVDMTKVQAYSPEITFAWARTGMSYAWKDPRFDVFRAQFESEEIWFGGYHVLYPAQSGVTQAANFVKIAGRSLKGYAWDVELTHGCTPAKMLETLRVACLELLNAGLPVWIYSSPIWFNSWVIPASTTPPGWFRDIKWWLAQYLTSGAEHPGPVSLVRGITADDVYIHQTSSSFDGRAIGQPVGSPKFDGNRWLIGKPESPVSIPVEISDSKKLELLWSAHPELRG